MDNREEIKNVFNAFVEALEQDNVRALDDLLTEDVTLSTSNMGDAVGRDNVTSALKWKGSKLNYSRSRIFNFVAFSDGDFARQSAVVTTLVGQNTDDYFHYFHFGGYYLNDYILTDGKWKISRIRFNLDMEDGNTSFVSGWWKLIDYRYFEGTPLYPIVSETDAPWRAIKHKDSLGTEQEQVLDSLYRYAWGIDHADMEVLISCFDENIKMSSSTPKEENKFGLSPLAEMVRFMKYKRYKEPIMEHIYKIKSVTVNGDEAVVEAYRYEPHRMGTQKLNKINMEWDFYSGKFEYTFRKLPGDWPKGGWKMTVNTVKELKVFSVQSHDASRFY